MKHFTGRYDSSSYLKVGDCDESHSITPTFETSCFTRHTYEASRHRLCERQWVLETSGHKHHTGTQILQDETWGSPLWPQNQVTAYRMKPENVATKEVFQKIAFCG